jgi:hypothetical protein
MKRFAEWETGDAGVLERERNRHVPVAVVGAAP